MHKIRTKRERFYGAAKVNHDNIGLQFTGILQQHYGIKLPHAVPGHLVALFQCMVKANRAATPLAFNPDNYVDGQAYFEIAGDVDDRNPNNKETGNADSNDRMRPKCRRVRKTKAD